MVRFPERVYSGRVQRPIWVQIFAVSWLLWFAATVSDAAGLRACPVHSSIVNEKSSPAHAHDHLTTSGTETHVCDCLGLGCCPSKISGPSLALAANSVGYAVVVGEEGPAPYEVPLAVTPPHSHPFATAPPTLSL